MKMHRLAVRSNFAAAASMTHGERRVDRQFSANLSRGLAVLAAFTSEHAALGNRELSDRTGLPKATISRLTYTLLSLGYLARSDAANKFRLGAGVLSLAHPLLASMRVRQIARRHMEPLAVRTGCTVNLGVRDREHVVYVESSRCDTGNPYLPDIGSVRPLLTSAIGRALILGSSADEREAILNRLRLSQPVHFAAGLAILERDAAHFAEHGFCWSAGDWRRDIHAVAAPLRGHAQFGRLALSCTVAVLRGERPDAVRERIAPPLLDTVRSIEEVLGAAR